MKVTYTYRTDLLLDKIGKSDGFVNQRNCPRKWIGFAIELETELQEATFEIERLRKANFQLREGAEEQKQRIHRLEYAGHQLLLWLDRNTPATVRNDWLKAKEDKP